MNSLDIMNKNKIIQCHECALLVHLPTLKLSQKAQCPRCGLVLSAMHDNALERIMVFAITALIFLILSFVFDFLAFSRNGLENSFSLLESLHILINNNYHILAAIEIITVFIVPMMILLILVYLSFYLFKGKFPPKGHHLLRIVYALLPWSMVEIFLIGALVSIIKIVSMADIYLGMSFYSFALYSLFITLVVLHLDKQQFTQLLNDSMLQQAASSKLSETDNCSNKHLARSQHSIQQTWAFIFTAIIVYIPANIMPIMTTRAFGQDEPSTILGGVILLWEMGSFPIALIIFIASIVVPIAKIVIISWLNYTVQKKQYGLTSPRIKLYRLAEFIGRWSMIDVFVVIILASMIQLGDTMSIYPGKAILAFCGVVILTMLAAMSFDSSLIWPTKNNDC